MRSLLPGSLRAPHAPHAPVVPDGLVGVTGGWRALLGALLLGACVSDVRARRIPNLVVAALLVAGLARAALGATGEGRLVDATAPGLVGALVASVVGLAVGLPFYAVRVLGAGDVKLFAAAAAWIGPAAVPRACWWTAVSGGALALGWLTVRALRRRAGVPEATGDGAALPYGLAVAAGVLAGAWLPPA